MNVVNTAVNLRIQ